MAKRVVVRRSEMDHHYHSRETENSSYVVRTVRYKECQRNFAANVGGHAVDGCREFMPVGEEGTNEALVCAACGCHRNFHKRVEQEEVVSSSTE